MVERAALYPRPLQPRKPDRSERLALGLQFLAGAIGGGALTAFVLLQLGKTAIPELIGMVAICVALLWLHTVAHEAGHAIAGIAAGRRLVGAGVGPLRVERGSGGWRVRWGGGVRGIGGFAALLPVHGRGDSMRAEALFLLGGPLANLLLAALALVVLLVAPPAGTVAFVSLAAAAFIGVMFGIVNLAPFRSRGWRTDGAHLFGLLRDTPESRIGRVQQRVVSLSWAGVRPRDWPVADLHVPTNAAPDQAVGANLLRLSWALDCADGDAAAAAAGALADAYPSAVDGQRQGIALLMAIYAAQCTRDAGLLAAWRPLCEGGLLDASAYRLWLDGEAAAMRGDSSAAHLHATKAREALVRVHDAGSVTVLRERIDALEARLHAAGSKRTRT